MNRKDVFEIKSRFKKTECTFTRFCGCYVNANKEILVNFNKTFLNLEDEEFYKYLDIAKKSLSGTIGNNLIELNFRQEEMNEGGKQPFLLGIRESKLKNAGLLDTFYQLIIDTYDYVGNYLILAFHDAYDVMVKTSDNRKLDESEEVYDYLLFVICPVTLTKPALGYLEDENRIGARYRDWIVGPPETGFIFPAFTERSTDIDSVMFYTKNSAKPHRELMELVLGCRVKPTAAEQKNTFHAIVKNAVDDTETSDKIFSNIQESLNDLMEEKSAFSDSLEPAILTNDNIREILNDNDLPKEITEKINTAFAQNFSDHPPAIEHLIDKKVLAVNQKSRSEEALVKKVEELQERLSETINTDSSNVQDNSDIQNNVEIDTENVQLNCDVVVNVKPEKMPQIKSQMMGGKKCIIIPMDENERIKVNGVTDLI